jgi:hypothetical protein
MEGPEPHQGFSFVHYPRKGAEFPSQGPGRRMRARRLIRYMNGASLGGARSFHCGNDRSF